MSAPRVRDAGPVVLVTCEHGGHDVPPELASAFADAGELLASHRGWDAGALSLARRLSGLLDAPLRYATLSRLVVDLNRSPRHPRVLSERTRTLPLPERERLMALYHEPHRAAVDADVAAALAAGRSALHLGVHTFTPVFHGEVRRADLALLYDPARAAERDLSARWVAALRSELPGLALRRNQPYRGVSDGLTTWLRARHGERYLGIEIEVNQRWLDASGDFPRRFATGLARALGVALEAAASPDIGGAEDAPPRSRRRGPESTLS